MCKLLVFHISLVWIVAGTFAQTQGAAENSQPLCLFPPGVVGNWVSTLWGDIEIKESEILFSSDISSKETRRLDCFNSSDSDSLYVLRSNETFESEGAVFSVFTCFQILTEKQNTDYLHISVITVRNTFFGGRPLQKYGAKAEIPDPIGKYCNQTNTTEAELLRKGRESEGALRCPETLHGVFKTNYSGEYDETVCPEGATMSSCEEDKKLVFNYSSCHEHATEGSEDPDVYFCVGLDHYQLLLYRNNSASFSCLTFLGNNTNSDVNSTKLVELSDNNCGNTWLPKQEQNAKQNENLLLTYADMCESEKTTVPLETTTTSIPIVNTTMADNTTGVAGSTDETPTPTPAPTVTTTDGNTASLMSNSFMAPLTATTVVLLIYSRHGL